MNNINNEEKKFNIDSLKKASRLGASGLVLLISLKYVINGLSNLHGSFGYSSATEVLDYLSSFFGGMAGVEIATCGFVPELDLLIKKIKTNLSNPKESYNDETDEEVIARIKENISILLEQKKLVLEQENNKNIVRTLK